MTITMSNWKRATRTVGALLIGVLWATPTNVLGQGTLAGNVSGSASSITGVLAGDVAGPQGATVVDPSIARNAEIFPAVLAADGAGSGLDADLFDGLDSSGFVGATGAQGPAGNDGSPGGVSGWEIVTVTLEITINPGAFQNLIASCPNGKKLTGGGGSAAVTIVSDFALVRSRPLDDDSWQASWTNVDTVARTEDFTTYAICADVS
jgi:hypothetical protein